MPTTVVMTHKITIDKPREVVFDYVSDLTNDPKWRTEVDVMDVQGPVDAVGTIAVEYSTLFLGLKKTVTTTVTKEFERPSHVRFETLEDDPTWLESYRETRDLGDDRTEMIYRLSFDVAADGLLGKVSAFVLKALYEPRLPKYLRLLKTQLEAA